MKRAAWRLLSGAQRGPQPWSFRAHLLALVLTCAIPLTGMAVLTITWLGNAQRELARSQIIGSARVFSSSIDHHLGNAEQLLRGLADFFATNAVGVADFYLHCRTIAIQFKGGILLVDPYGNEIFDTGQPFRSGLPSISETPEFHQAVATNESRISNLYLSGIDGSPTYSIYVPIVKDGESQFILMMSFPASSLNEFLVETNFPADWIVATIDRDDTIMALSKNARRIVGAKASHQTQAAANDQGDVTFRRTDEKEAATYQAVFRSPLSGWKVMIELPQAVVDAPLWQSLRRFAGLGVGVLLLAFGTAFAIARYLSRDMNKLSAAARALGRHEPMPTTSSTVREINSVASALSQAGRELIDRERQLRDGRRHLLQAQRVAGMGSIERDLKTGEMECTDETYRLFGVDKNTFVPTAENLINLTHEEDRERLRATALATRQGVKPQPIEYRIVRPDGEVRTIRRDAELTFDEAGAPRRLLIAFKDVTEIRAAEERQRQLERQLHHAQKLESLGTLAGGIAHDLNNTLVPILSLSKLAAKKFPEGSRERTNLDMIMTAGERARDLVRQILAFSRDDAPARSVVDLATLLRDSLKMLRASIPSTIEFDERIEAVPPVLADSSQLHQVIINLIVNASQAIGEQTGTIVVALTTPPGDGQGGQPQRSVELTVRDNGCGMEESVLRRVFEPFFTTKGVGEGTGLGLSVVHGIVTKHGGRMMVESRVGEGTCFTVYLPTLSERDLVQHRAKEIAA